MNSQPQLSKLSHVLQTIKHVEAGSVFLSRIIPLSLIQLHIQNLDCVMHDIYVMLPFISTFMQFFQGKVSAVYPE